MPPTPVYALLLALAAAALAVVFTPMVKAWRRAGGARLVSCPETREVAAVEIDRADAAFNALLGVPEVQLRSCTRWPGKAGCGQECLVQIGTPHRMYPDLATGR